MKPILDTLRTLAMASLLITALAGANAADQVTHTDAPVVMPTTVTVGNEPLMLNGTGMRTRFFVDVYEAALYTPKPVRTPEAFFALDGAKRLHAVAMREIDSEALGRLFMKGIISNNSREDAMRQSIAIAQVADAFGKRRKLKSGDTFGFDFVPEEGTRLLINGKRQGGWIRDPEFFPLAMRLWFGPNPADNSLKAALLGQQPPTPPVAMNSL